MGRQPIKKRLSNSIGCWPEALSRDETQFAATPLPANDAQLAFLACYLTAEFASLLGFAHFIAYQKGW
jgi:hypothetical protein